jgi:hypothetical protein
MEVRIISTNQRDAAPVTVSFPIEDYEDTYRKLDAIDAGDALARDCYVEEIYSDYDSLMALVGSEVNVDELDYLAKRFDSFCLSEDVRFEGAAVAAKITGIEGFINLSFCEQATVIDDFSDLYAVGKAHYMNKNSGGIAVSDHDRVDFRRVALDLIHNEDGQITPHGVVYLNGMELERLYQGREFPLYIYKPCVLLVGAQQRSDPASDITALYLPMPQICVERALKRGGLDAANLLVNVESYSVSSDLFRWIDWNGEKLEDLNKMASAIASLDDKELSALCVVSDRIEPGTACELRDLAYEMFPEHAQPEPEEKPPEQGMTMGGL